MFPTHAVACLQSHLLYVDDELSLQDCCDMDDSSSVGSSDLVQDYKKSAARLGPPTQMQRPASQSAPSSVASEDAAAAAAASWAANYETSGQLASPRFPSNESMASLENNLAVLDEIQWKIVAVTKTSGMFR